MLTTLHYINFRISLTITKRLLFKSRKSISRIATILKIKKKKNNTRVQQEKNKIKIIVNNKKHNEDEIVANKIDEKN